MSIDDVMNERKIVDYVILQFKEYSQLSNEASRLIINEGYEPWGYPLFPTEHGPHEVYTQAMVKYE